MGPCDASIHQNWFHHGYVNAIESTFDENSHLTYRIPAAPKKILEYDASTTSWSRDTFPNTLLFAGQRAFVLPNVPCVHREHVTETANYLQSCAQPVTYSVCKLVLNY